MFGKKPKAKEIKEPDVIVEDNTPDLEVDLNEEPDEEEEAEAEEPKVEEVAEPEAEEVAEAEIEEVEEDLKDIDLKIKKLQEKKKEQEQQKKEEKLKLQIVSASLIEGGLYQYTAVSNKLLQVGAVIFL